MINHQLFGIDKPRNLFQLMPRFPQCRSAGKTSGKSYSRIWRWNATRGSKHRSEALSSRPGAMLYGFFVFCKVQDILLPWVFDLLNMHITTVLYTSTSITNQYPPAIRPRNGKSPHSWMISPAINYKHPFSLGISMQPPCLMTLETNQYYFGSRKPMKSEFSLQLWPSTVHTIAYKKCYT